MSTDRNNENKQSQEETIVTPASEQLEDNEHSDEDFAAIIAHNEQLKSENAAKRNHESRRAAFAELLAENEKLLKEQDLITTPAPRSRPAEPVRPKVLSFNTPAAVKHTPFKEGRPDFYARAIMTSMVGSMPDAPTTSLKRFTVEILKPSAFDGAARIATPTQSAESAQVRLEHWIDAVERYLNYEAERQGVTPSPEEFCASACGFLVGDAARVINRLLVVAHQAQTATGVMKSVLWPDVRAELRTKYGKPQSGHKLIKEMMTMSQEHGETVAKLTTRFEEKLVELTRQELDSRDLAAALYINILNPTLRDMVEERVNLESTYFEKAGITSTESRAVIAHLHTIASAFEESLMSKSRRNNHSQSSPAQNQQPQRAVSSNQNVANTHSTNQSVRPSESAPRKNVIHQVPDALFKERGLAGLCGLCGSESHSMRQCRNGRNATPMTAAQRNTARANIMEVMSQFEPLPASSPQQTEPKKC